MAKKLEELYEYKKPMPKDWVVYEKEGNIARIILNRPEKFNAMTDPMFRVIQEMVHQADDDDDVKVVIFKGNGPNFTGGFDVSNPDIFYGIGGEDLSHGLRFPIHCLKFRSRVFQDIMFNLKPTIAQIQGLCIGAGLFLTLPCDFSIASEDAVFGQPEERYGSAGGIWPYPLYILNCGLKKAKELLMLGRKYNAREAERLGLVNKVVPRDKLEEEVNELAKAICGLPKDGLVISKAYSHLVYGVLGIPQFFDQHAMHALFTRMVREPGEFDFRKTMKEKGLKATIAERDRLWAGRYWDW